jgi:hypothetical protein
MPEEKPKRAPRSRRVVVPRPANKVQEARKHPTFWVECFGCSGSVPMEVAGAKACLPEGWARIHLRDRSLPGGEVDYYASEDCHERAARRLATMADRPREEVMIVVVPYVPLQTSAAR